MRLLSLAQADRYQDQGGAEEDFYNPEIARLRILLGGLRLVVVVTMTTLRDKGLLPPDALRAMRNDCIDAALSFAAQGESDPLKDAISMVSAQEIAELFGRMIPLDS